MLTYSADPQRYQVTEFSDIAFCYCDESTETHILPLFCSLILDVCAEQGVTLDQLAAKTASLLDTEANQDWFDKNRAAVSQLLRLHLITASDQPDS